MKMIEKNNTLRILENLPTFYAKHSESTNYKIFNSIGNELDDQETQQTNLVSEIQIDTSTGSNLDGLGALFRLIRQSNETDVEFRARIKSHWQSNIGGGTVEAIRTAISNVMGVSTSAVDVTESDLKIGVKVTVTNPDDWDLFQTAIDTANITKAAGTYISVDLEPSYVITGIFTAGVSSVGMRDVV